LHVCFCSYSNVIENGTKVDVDSWNTTTDEEYLGIVRKEFFTREKLFKPFLIFHNLGHDTARGDYGDRGLTRDFFPQLAKEVKECADEACNGRYLIITHGGSRADIAEYIFPRIAEILGQ
jgi:acetoin utilization deacetylase AcuC-like enzyme